ncbi:MAG: preprotein translocase subunit SecG [Flavobacteriaceae bacterium]
MMSFTVFLVLITIVCFLLVVVIMVQNPKGGGLSSTFGGGATIGGGVKKTTDFLDKSTWILGVTLIVLILLSSLAFTGNSSNSKIYDGGSAPAPIENLPTVPSENGATNDATQTEETTN